MTMTLVTFQFDRIVKNCLFLPRISQITSPGMIIVETFFVFTMSPSMRLEETFLILDVASSFSMF